MPKFYYQCSSPITLVIVTQDTFIKTLCQVICALLPPHGQKTLQDNAVLRATTIYKHYSGL